MIGLAISFGVAAISAVVLGAAVDAPPSPAKGIINGIAGSALVLSIAYFLAWVAQG